MWMPKYTDFPIQSVRLILQKKVESYLPILPVNSYNYFPMPGKIDLYVNELRSCDDITGYLRQHSNLPGPRGNLELAEAVFLTGDRELFLRLLASDSPAVSENTAEVFVVFCGIIGLGKLLAGGDRTCQDTLRRYANDSRWRIREAAAIGLQKYGLTDMTGLLAVMEGWASGSYLEQRAVVAALCEPALLRDEAVVRQVLVLLDTITTAVSQAVNRKAEDFRILRQALGYGWSVAAAAHPEAGLAVLERWLASSDPDVRWIMRENLKKKRLERAAPEWVAKWKML